MTTPNPRAFVQRVAAKCFDTGGDLEYSDLLDIGLETGCLVTEPFDEERHQDVPGAEEMGPGDVVYVLAAELGPDAGEAPAEYWRGMYETLSNDVVRRRRNYERRIAALKVSVRIYGTHLSVCRFRNGGDRCTCGFFSASAPENSQGTEDASADMSAWEESWRRVFEAAGVSWPFDSHGATP